MVAGPAAGTGRADPDNIEARALQADALEQLGYQAESAVWRNFYLSAASELRNGHLALGTADLGSVLAPLQMLVLLAFISFYVPCVSTFAVMLKTLGRRDAWLSVSISVGVALLVAGLLRFVGSGLELLGP